ncbi:MAG: hypothetical protein ACRBF0_13570 [Calditrichia bacterium]
MSSEQNALHIPHIRPRFRITVPSAKNQLMDRIRNLLHTSDERIVGTIVDNHVILDITKEDIHYWSPQVNFRIEEDNYDPTQSVLSGIIGPRPKVWTLFMFIYFAIGVIGFFISSFGVARLMMGEQTILLWAFPVAILLMLTAYLAGKMGERLGSDQVEVLKSFIIEAISNPTTEL